jgi:hypothetical protein
MAVFTFGGVQFREAGEYASPRPSVSGANARLRAEYLVDWNSHVLAEVALLGKCDLNSSITPSGARQKWFDRTTPHPHPTYPWLYASEVTETRGDGTPLGFDASGVQKYSDARMTVIYSRLRWDILENTQINDGNGVPNEGLLKRYVYREAAKAKEKMITYKAGSWIFRDNGRTYQSAVGRSWIVQDLTWVWVQVLFDYLPRAYIASMGGFTNKFPFDGYPEGTLLCRAMSYEMDGMPNGRRSCNAHINASYSPFGWNYFPDPQRNYNFFEIGTTRSAIDTNHTATPYPELVDFSTLFQPQ